MLTAANANPNPVVGAAVPESPEKATSLFASRKDIKPLTALRFFPAFAVVLYHASEYFSCWHGLGNFYVAGQAVTFFFILSGFILTHNYFQLNDAKSACSFYLARFARIWPAHATSLALLLFLIPEVFKVRGAAWPLFLSNLFMTHSWIPTWRVFFSYNAPSWSNATEFFFYLSFPFLLFWLRKKWYLPILFTGALLSGLICFCNLKHLPEFDPLRLSTQGLIYIHPLSRVFEFSAGMVAAFCWRNSISKIDLNQTVATILEAGIIVSVCVLNVYSGVLRYAAVPWAGDAGAYWIQNCGPSILGFSLLIMIFAMERGFFSRVLSNSFLVLLGELSFGVYMLHGVLITYLGVNYPQQQSLNVCLLFLVLVFVAAHLMSELVEKPVRKIMLTHGNNLIALFGPKQDLAQKHDSKNSQKDKKPKLNPWKKRLLLLAELAVLAGLIYFSLPGLEMISESQASVLAKNASVQNVEFSPYLKCKSGAARDTKNAIELTLVWEAMKAEYANFSVTAIALDANGKSLGSTSYAQDGHFQRVDKGACWVDKCEIALAPQAHAAKVMVSVTRNKRENLHSISSPHSDSSLIVPVLH